MRFLNSIIEEGEKPICRSRLHGIYLFGGLMWLVVLSGIGWIADYNLWVNFGAYIPAYMIDTSYLRVPFNPGWIGGLFTLAGLVAFVTDFLKFISTSIVVTNRRFLYKTGFLNVTLDATDISDILGVHVDQGWFGQFFGYGKIRLDCRFIEDVLIPYAKNPYELTKIIQKVKNEIVARQGTVAPMDENAEKAPRKPQAVSQTLIQINGNNPVYIVDKVPADEKTPLKQLPKSLGDNMLRAFRSKA